MINGLVHIYSGDGKGKTTASIGIAVRCKGAGKEVLFVQFMKGSSTSETEPLKKLGIKVIRKETITKFVFAMTPEEKEIYKNDNEACFQYAKENCDKYDLIVFDEITSAISTGMLSKLEVIDFLKNKPNGLEVVMTGRDPDKDLLPFADYISEVVLKRHPYEKGINARLGIEY